ncbi:MAG: hypothetical protein M3Y53_08140 [Thermoproteota archaeon]|nr:hypothetical protein [Thermoproteota archaeon]
MLHKSILHTQSVSNPLPSPFSWYNCCSSHITGLRGAIIVVGFILLAVIAGIGVVKALTISSSGHTFHSKLKRNTDEDF